MIYESDHQDRLPKDNGNEIEKLQSLVKEQKLVIEELERKIKNPEENLNMKQKNQEI